MRKKQKINSTLRSFFASLLIVLGFGTMIFATSTSVFAVDSNSSSSTPSAQQSQSSKEPDAGGCVVLPKTWCEPSKTDAKNGGTIIVILKWVLRILTGGIGIVAVGAIVWAGILYTTAADNTSQVQKAKDTIKQVVWGLLLYGFMAIVINFLVPGGIFG